MKLSDYVADFLARQGIHHVFGLTGGAVVHLFDSIALHPQIRPIFTLHEQAAAFAAEAYARIRNGLGAALVTTGPGGTNAITGVCAAWLDSVPCMYVSGQARLAHISHGKPIRQLGVQEFDILALVTPITKCAAMVEDPRMIRYHLERAAHTAREGRPGPVWLDIPLDVQWAAVDPKTLPGFDPAECAEDLTGPSLVDQVGECLEFLAAAERPLVLAGYGVRLARAEAEFRQFIDTFRLPFLSTWNASDLVPTDNELYAGRPGIFGQRGANLAIQNCDLLLSIGSHLCISITGARFDAFAREAKKVMVDVDQAELDHRTVRVDLPIRCDAGAFLRETLRQASNFRPTDISAWRDKCRHYKLRHNIIPREWQDQTEHVNPYVFVDILSDMLQASDVIVIDGGGTINQVAFQTLRVKEGQRLMISGGICAMGSGLPESIGACLASGRRTICLVGDGGMQLNIQELQTIAHHSLPVKVFVINNGGYLAIRHTQDGFLGGLHVGSAESGGLSLPDIVKVATAYGIKADRVSHHGELQQKVREVLDAPGPMVCDIMVARDQQVAPRQGFDMREDGTGVPRPLEDMYPFLDRREFLENMIVRPWVNPES